MKNLKKFDTHAEYEIYIASSAIKPNVSICADNKNHVHYNPVPPPAQFDFVDLGLPSGLKWAKANLGAETETDYGKYFQWGDTVGYTDASHSTWSTCPFNNGSSTYDSAYFESVRSTVCPNNILSSTYDACYQQSGGKYRMPTATEWQELLEGTTYSWVNNYNGSGVHGELFTSKTNSNSIFIPAAGFADSGSVDFAGSFCRVWSSSLYPDYLSHAYYLDANPGDGSLLYTGFRYWGQSLRCVSE